MSILIDEKAKVVVQGITGREGMFHTAQMIEYGTNIVAGMTPGKGGMEVLGVPVFDAVREAVEITGADTSVIFVPAKHAADALLEASYAGLDLIVCITEGIPTQDMILAANLVKRSRTHLIGPNCPGIISPGKGKIGIMAGSIFRQGNIGVVSRSGTLTYEIVDELTRVGFGQSTCVGIGGDPILGSTFADVLPLFEEDVETEAVVLVGEIGGSDEEVAAEYIKLMSKPVVGFISGRTAPPGKRMGHAGAIISGKTGTAEAKVEALTAAGVPIANTTREIADLLKAALD